MDSENSSLQTKHLKFFTKQRNSVKLFIGKLFHRLIQPRRRPAGHDADGGSVLILLGAVTILIKLL